MELTTSMIGWVAAFCTTISFLPQALRIIQTRNTKSISFWMYLVLNLGILLWLIYGWLLNEMPIILANAITFTFTFTILILKIRYK
jgi:MtN3 and saliva related transmembrane protein